MRKKILSVGVALGLLAGTLTGCSANNQETDDLIKNDENIISVVCTTFPQYDWVLNVIGTDNKNVDVTLLMKTGADLHNYQPTAEDIVSINNSDLFIYVGGESDNWVDKTLESAGSDVNAISMMQVLGEKVKEEVVVEGMEDDGHSHDEENEDHDHEEHDEHDEHHHEEVEYDEHVWLSLRNAGVITNEIANNLALIDTQNADMYKKNAQEYVDRLNSLDDEYKNMTSSARRQVILVGDRFPFRYLADDYGLDYYAAFPGCSADSEASFETIIFLANKTDELALPSIFAIDGSNQVVAKTIVDNTKEKNQTILTLNSMQSVTNDDIIKGSTYLGIMQSNLDVLKEALN